MDSHWRYLPANFPDGRPERSRDGLVAPFYVAIYWTFRSATFRPLALSKTIQLQREIVQKYVKRHGGSIIREAEYQEPSNRPTARILVGVSDALRLAYENEYYVIYVDPSKGSRWRTHGFLKLIKEEGDVNVVAIHPSNELIEHFKNNRQDVGITVAEASRRNKIASGMVNAVESGAQLALFSPKAPEIQTMGLVAIQNNVRKFHEELRDCIEDICGWGLSYSDMAAKLNEVGFHTRTGLRWTAETMRKAYKKLPSKDEVRLQTTG